MEEILVSISKKEILEYRLVNKSWDNFLRPFVLNSLEFNPKTEHDPKFQTLLSKFGKYIKELCFGYLDFGNSLPLQDWEIRLIQENCPNIEALKFNRKKHEGDVADILELGFSFPKIKHLSLLGKLKPRKLLLLQPLFSSLESLEIECVCDNVRAQNRFIHRLSSPSLKKLSLQCRLQADVFSLIGTELPPDLILQISKRSSRHNITYVINREKVLFNSVEFFDEDADLRICVSFDLSQTKDAASHWRIYEGIQEKALSEQFKFVESVFGLDAEPYVQAEAHLPLVKCFSYCNRFLKSEHISTFFKQMTSVQEIRISLDYSPPQTSFPLLQFKTIKLYVEFELSPHFFSWVSQCFPFLRSLSIVYYVRRDVLEKLEFLEFQSLLFISCPLKQPMRFWRNMIKAAPNLQVVSTFYDDEYTPQLKSEFKHICFVQNLMEW